jgi:hypothetical protein
MIGLPWLKTEYPIWTSGFAHRTLLLPATQRICHPSRLQPDRGVRRLAFASDASGKICALCTGWGSRGKPFLDSRWGRQDPVPNHSAQLKKK